MNFDPEKKIFDRSFGQNSTSNELLENLKLGFLKWEKTQTGELEVQFLTISIWI